MEFLNGYGKIMGMDGILVEVSIFNVFDDVTTQSHFYGFCFPCFHDHHAKEHGFVTFTHDKGGSTKYNSALSCMIIMRRHDFITFITLSF